MLTLENSSLKHDNHFLSFFNLGCAQTLGSKKHFADVSARNENHGLRARASGK